ncbi:Ca-activated chloride channel family protein [Tamilnaduibacter salinus]|uniref:Ca-activated chloride channel family protein n=1 Tax=Tamilnaduibacter salinus TaxID=1484056 RepID=A0A2U1D1M5_9GAMM|nr:VWA domain-containing protein [Tamilnaduibacter salinus]PVY79293.1 Ca-activated chloride channel family protein [Tamilnaduibacter salinus]
MADLHFLRPLWLLLLLVLPLVPLWVRYGRQGQHGWSALIPSPLLRALTDDGEADAAGLHRRGTGVLAATLVVLTAVALAGPSWRQAPTPLKTSQDSLVIVLDLSLSMLATDEEPDRLTRAKRKIRDILSARQGSLTGLVVYAGDAHVVTPLTDDRQTIETLIDVLDPTMMPASGNRADLGVKRALALMERGAPAEGRILLMADNLREADQQRIPGILEGTPYDLSTLTVGTREGSPIPLKDRGFIRDQGNVVISRADPDALARVARATGGKSARLALNSEDIKRLALGGDSDGDWQETDRGRSIDRWQDDGYWLLWPLGILALLAWRRGLVLALVIVLVPVMPRTGQALDWDGLWQREDQRAEQMIESDPARAANQLTDPQWRGSALYRSGDFKSSAEAFSQSDSADAAYNLGNALARQGRLKAALDAYRTALERNPNHTDAAHNRDIVREALKKRQQQKQQSGNGQQKRNRQQESRTGSQDGQSGQNQQGDQQRDQNGQSGQNQQGRQGNPSESSTTPGQADDQSQQAPSSKARRDQQNPGGGQGNAAPRPGETSERPLSQSEEQWLRRIPDDPSGLMRRKFLYQYRERSTPRDSKGDTPW